MLHCAVRIGAAAGCALALAACAGGGTGGAGTGTTGNSQAPLRFARCMRSHGVPRFPDPGSGGGISLSRSLGIDPLSPAFQSAQRACQRAVPGGGPKSGPVHITAAQRRRALAFARCMRTHGEPGFPDPVSSPPSGSTLAFVVLGLVFPLRPGLDPGSPAFRQAASACGILPPGAKARP